MSKGEFGTQVKRSLLCLPEMSFRGEFKGGLFSAIYHPWRCDQMAWWEWTADYEPVTDAEMDQVLNLIRQFGAKVTEGALAMPANEEVGGAFEERDWTAAIRGLLNQTGEVPQHMWWAPGDQVSSTNTQATVWTLTEDNLYNCLFESMRSGMDLPRCPTVLRIPLASLADWEVRDPEPNGAILVRILILSDEQRQCGSLKEAMSELPGDTRIGLVGLRATPRQTEFLDALSCGIQRAVAFEPGTHSYHPLRKQSPPA